MTIIEAIAAETDGMLDAWGCALMRTIGIGPYRGVVYYDPDTDDAPATIRPVPKRPSPVVHTPAPARSVECPCGIHRDDCEYHR